MKHSHYNTCCQHYCIPMINGVGAPGNIGHGRTTCKELLRNQDSTANLHWLETYSCRQNLNWNLRAGCSEATSRIAINISSASWHADGRGPLEKNHGWYRVLACCEQTPNPWNPIHTTQPTESANPENQVGDYAKRNTSYRSSSNWSVLAFVRVSKE